MISKATKGKGFGGLVRYVSRDFDRTQAEPIAFHGLTDFTTAAREMRAEAAASRCERPAYHLMISLAPGETLERAVWQDTARTTLADLGLARHQWLAYRHQEGGCEHLHVVVNRVREGKAAGLAHDYRTRERTMRRLEARHGLQEPQARGRQAWAKAPAVRAALDRASTWEDAQGVLGALDVRVEAVRREGNGIRGLRFVDANGSAIKASALGRGYGHTALVKRFGDLPTDLCAEKARSAFSPHESLRTHYKCERAEIARRRVKAASAPSVAAFAPGSLTTTIGKTLGLSPMEIKVLRTAWRFLAKEQQRMKRAAKAVDLLRARREASRQHPQLPGFSAWRRQRTQLLSVEPAANLVPSLGDISLNKIKSSRQRAR